MPRARLAQRSRDASVFVRAIGAPLAFALAFAACAASPALASSASSVWQAIVLKGAQVPRLVGSVESRLEVLAIHDGHVAPIPFQVDEVLPDGRYALTDGPEPLADDSPGILDRDDEIAMMLSDLGDRAEPLPRELPSGALEIEASGASGAHRYAYIAAVPSPRLNPVSYVSYDSARNRVDAAGYRMAFRGDFPIELALRKSGGGITPSLIDGSEVRATARVLALFKLRLSGNGVSNRVLAWHAGPIRLIRRVSHSVRLVFGIKSPRVLSGEIFYRDYAEDSFVARVLWVPRALFGDVQVHTWLDFVGVGGFTLSWSAMKGRPLELGAGNAQQDIRRDPPEVKWLALTGRGKIVMQTFTPSPDLAALRRRLYYCDGAAADGSRDLSWDASPGCSGAALQIGYLITGWENLAAGTHRVKSVLMILPDSADPDAIARELAREPAVSVRPLRP